MAGNIRGWSYWSVNGNIINSQELTESRVDTSVVSPDPSGGFKYKRRMSYDGVSSPANAVIRTSNNTTGANTTLNSDQANIDALFSYEADNLNETLFRIDTNGGAETGQVRISAAGKIAYHDFDDLAGTPTDEGTYVLQPNDKVHIQGNFTGSTGAYVITVWTYSVDEFGNRIGYVLRDTLEDTTSNLSEVNIGKFQMGRTANLAPDDGVIDWYAWIISVGGHPEDLSTGHGYVKFHVQTAVAIVTDNANWTPSAGANKVAMVDEENCDSTEDDHGTYIEHAADGNNDVITFSLSSPTFPENATILAVRPHFVIWNDTAGTGGNFKLRHISGATTTDTSGVLDPGDMVAATKLPHGRGPIYNVNPATGVAYTYAEVRDLVIGVMAMDEATVSTYEVSTVQLLTVVEYRASTARYASNARGRGRGRIRSTI